MNFLSRFLKDQKGATAIEYGLILALVFLAIVTAVTVFAQRSTAMYQKINDAVTGATS